LPSKQTPVLLKLSNVAANSSLSFNFTTTGVKWSLGGCAGDNLGFSYNVAPDDISDNPASSIQSIGFNDSLLAIRTAVNAPSLSQFTLSLFLDCEGDADSLQGYCTMNNEAEVLAYFGSECPVYWRNGRISAVLRPPATRYRNVLLAVKDALPGSNIEIEVGTHPDRGRAYWCLGPPLAETQGVQVTCANGALPLTSMSYTTNHIRLQTLATRGTGSMDILIGAYVSWQPEELAFVYLKAHCDANISVYAQIGNRQPQYVSPTYTLFTL